MNVNRKWLRAGDETTSRGVRSGVSPQDLSVGQAAWSRNAVHRGGHVRSRPGFTERLDLPSGRIQGFEFFDVGSGQLIASIGGRVYRLAETSTWSHEDITPDTIGNSPSRDKVWMIQADGRFLIQDGQSAAIIYDGAFARRADLSLGEIPVGGPMAYDYGRVWLASGRILRAGDIKQFGDESHLTFTETDYWLGGGYILMPSRVEAMSFIPLLDTETGSGPLVVAGAGWVRTIRADITDRSSWQELERFATRTLPIGTRADFVPVNQDLALRASDGIRTIRTARGDLEGFGTTPLSDEVSQLTRRDTKRWLGASSGAYFDDRLFWTHSPYLDDGEVVHRGLIPLDFVPLSSMGQKAPPVYDGDWNFPGLSPVRIKAATLNGEERLFVLARRTDGSNVLVEVTIDGGVDRTLSGGALVDSEIAWDVDFRSYSFDSADLEKEIERAEVWLSGIRRSGVVTLYWRTQDSEDWNLWESFSFNNSNTATGSFEPLSDFRGKLTTTSPPEGFDALHRSQTRGTRFQLRIEATAACQVDRITAKARPIDESVTEIA